ncbi:hypothetical protein [Chryseobacterium paridis]|uniref:Uncharacterized protein n=1 Tax=Chryseobacterium paridis TaxID=2800328 RepID=A0ABS1FY30_9FLAO|nr:hypothetical protein [Chryseobacterium paridis]MBK1897307.1 hypothetical protein [Chryseobacterium paridis]
MNKKEALTKDLEEKISRAISKIGDVPFHLIPKINESNDNASPYVDIGEDGVIYIVIRERGVEYERNFCRDTDDALLKLFRYNSSEIARTKEKNNPDYPLKTLYASNRTFKLWAYTVSHSSLLLRSEMKYPDLEGYSKETSYNIDFEFWAVSYIDIPMKLDQVLVKKITEQELPAHIDRNLLKYDMKIFQLQSKEQAYHIIAGGLLIGENRWENEDRIFNYHSNLEHDKIIFCTNEK